MKTILAITLLSLCLASCGKKTTFEPRDTATNTTNTNSGNVANNGFVATEVIAVTLNAVKRYVPTVSFEDAQYNLSQTYKVTIPSFITVTDGNAGNFYAEIHIDSLVCMYKGGSSFTNPISTGNATEIANGKKYTFSYCYDSTQSGTTATANHAGDKVYAQDHLTLGIKNGDSQATTKATVILSLEK